MIENTVINSYENISNEERDNILNVDLSKLCEKTELTISNDELEDILENHSTADDGGIIAMTGFYYQMLVSILYLNEVFQGKWDGMFLDHHQDIVLLNESEKIVKFVQVKTKNVNYSDYDYKISNLWIPKLFKTAYDIADLGDYNIEFEIVSNCHYSDKKNYSLIPFYSMNEKNFSNDKVGTTSVEKFSEMVIASLNKNSKGNELTVSESKELNEKLKEKAFDYLNNFKMRDISYINLESMIVSCIPRTLGFKNSQLSHETVNNIIAEFFKACYSPKNAKIQLIKDEKLLKLKEYVKKQLTGGIDSAYHKASDEKILNAYFTKLKNDYSNSKLDQNFINEFTKFTDSFREDLETILYSSDLTMLSIMNIYLENDRGINVEADDNERLKLFEHLLSLLLFIKISIKENLKIEDNNYHILSIQLDQLLFLILGNNEDLKETSAIIQDFKDLFPRLSDAEKLRIANFADVSMIITGDFDKDDSDEYVEIRKEELEFSSKPSIGNEKLDDINTNRITDVQTPINIFYAHQDNCKEINRERKNYKNLEQMKTKIDTELKLNETI